MIVFSIIAETRTLFKTSRTILQLATQEILTVYDLKEFDTEEFKLVAQNLKQLSGILDPANLANATRHYPFILGAKSLKCLKIEADAIGY